MHNFDPQTDYYEILQVHPNAHQEVIKRAYRTIVGLLQSHPDLGGTHEEAVRLNEAYRVLSDQETRKAYDEARLLLQEVKTARARVTTAVAEAYTAHAPSSTPPSRHSTHKQYSNHPRTSADMLVIRCTRCGAKNRILQQQHDAVAVCGKCHATLSMATPQPQRELVVPATQLRLSQTATDRLLAHGEVHLKRTQIPPDRHYHCLRCHFHWIGHTNGVFPQTCPSCHSQHWSDFRIFHCQHCSFQFVSADLTSWPYKLFPTCPSCHTAHWHVGCEKHPFRRFYHKFIE